MDQRVLCLPGLWLSIKPRRWRDGAFFMASLAVTEGKPLLARLLRSLVLQFRRRPEGRL